VIVRGPCGAAYKDLEHLETPYVVKLHRYSLIAEPKAGLSQ